MKKILVVSIFALGASLAQASDSKKLSLVEMDLVTAGASASANGSSRCSTGVTGRGKVGMVCGGGADARSKGNYSEEAVAGNTSNVDGTSLVLSSNLTGTQFIAASIYQGSSSSVALASASSKKKQSRKKSKSRNRRR